jgi:hypothetical protein
MRPKEHKHTAHIFAYIFAKKEEKENPTASISSSHFRHFN